jgi:hypothetical protein
MPKVAALSQKNKEAAFYPTGLILNFNTYK